MSIYLCQYDAIFTIVLFLVSKLYKSQQLQCLFNVGNLIIATPYRVRYLLNINMYINIFDYRTQEIDNCTESMHISFNNVIICWGYQTNAV